jgi:Tol biopolymer transport system component
MRIRPRLWILAAWFSLSQTVGLNGEGVQGVLVFSANLGGHWELFIYRSEHAPDRLTSQSIDSRAPALSPDSKRVSYVTSDGSLWVLDIDSRKLRKLADRFSNGQYGYPMWVDSDVLAYTTYFVTPPTEDSDIHAYSFREAKQKTLVKQTGSQDFASVSASGKWIAFMSSVTTQVSGFGATISQQLWTVSLRTGKLEQLVTGSSRDTRPSWSPDEKRVAFSSDRQGGPNIWIVDVETKALTRLTSGPGEETDPCWSPDGRQILFVSTASGRRELRLIDVESRKITPLRPFGAKNVEIRDPAWGK